MIGRVPGKDSDAADGARRAMDYAGSVYLMRHGRTSLDVQHRSDGWLDLPLSDEGQLELIKSQQALKLVPLAKIYTPNLKRTCETAELIKSGVLSDPKIVVDDDAKTWNLGILAGTPKRYSRPEVKNLMAHPDETVEGGESYATFCNRFLPWLEARGAEAQHTGKPILVVCSGSNLRAIGEHLLGNQDAVDLTEGGLAVLHAPPPGWTGEALIGGEADDAKNVLDKALDNWS